VNITATGDGCTYREAVTRPWPFLYGGRAAKFGNNSITIYIEITVCFAPAMMSCQCTPISLIANDKTFCLSFFFGGPLDMIVMNNLTTNNRPTTKSLHNFVTILYIVLQMTSQHRPA